LVHADALIDIIKIIQTGNSKPAKYLHRFDYLHVKRSDWLSVIKILQLLYNTIVASLAKNYVYLDYVIKI
jgi:hypothetical protein